MLDPLIFLDKPPRWRLIHPALCRSASGSRRSRWYMLDCLLTTLVSLATPWRLRNRIPQHYSPAPVRVPVTPKYDDDAAGSNANVAKLLPTLPASSGDDHEQPIVKSRVLQTLDDKRLGRATWDLTHRYHLGYIPSQTALARVTFKSEHLITDKSRGSAARSRPS